ncbi:MAG: hypothetical protein AAF648_03375 [Pseudomonadota bacterium]
MSLDTAVYDIATHLDAVTVGHGGNALAAFISNPAAFSTAHYTLSTPQRMSIPVLALSRRNR